MTAIGVIVALIVAVVGVAAGYFIGYNNRKKTAEAQIGSAEAEATRLVNEAIKTADQKRKEAICSAASCTVLTFSESSNFFACTTFSNTSGTARSLTTKYFFFCVIFSMSDFLLLLNPHSLQYIPSRRYVRL